MSLDSPSGTSKCVCLLFVIAWISCNFVRRVAKTLSFTSHISLSLNFLRIQTFFSFWRACHVWPAISDEMQDLGRGVIPSLARVNITEKTVRPTQTLCVFQGSSKLKYLSSLRDVGWGKRSKTEKKMKKLDKNFMMKFLSHISSGQNSISSEIWQI